MSKSQSKLVTFFKFLSSWQGAVFGSLFLIATFGVLGTILSQLGLKSVENELALIRTEQSQVKNDAEPQQESLLYEVSQGDSLWKVAQNVLGCGEAYRLLVLENRLDDPDHLVVGQELTLPSSITQNSGDCEGYNNGEAKTLEAQQSPSNESTNMQVRVQRGDTLWDLAGFYLGDSEKWPQLFDKNRQVIGLDPDFIIPNQILELPQSGNYTTKSSDALNMRD